MLDVFMLIDFMPLLVVLSDFIPIVFLLGVCAG
jgi:hypothetical protein